MKHTVLFQNRENHWDNALPLGNGAVVKSIHGGLTREDATKWNFQIYCQNGMMENGRFHVQKQFNMYLEGENTCKGTWERYDPIIEEARHYALKATDMKVHGGADFYEQNK